MKLAELEAIRRKGLKPKGMVNISLMEELRKYNNVIVVDDDSDLSPLVGLAVEVFHVGENRKNTMEMIIKIIEHGAECVTSLNLRTKQRHWVWERGAIINKDITGWTWS